MIVTGKFVYIHLHKSGGSFVNECLMRFFPEAQMLGYHLPRSRIPATLAHLPVLGFVRSPWSYYVSWYAFQSQMAQPNALFRIASENRSLDFKGTLRNLLDLGNGSGQLDELIRQLPDNYGNQGLNLPGFALAPIRDTGKGFYSFLHDYMYGEGSPSATIGRVENLRVDLLDFLQKLDGALTSPLRDFIEHAAPRNTSNHASIAEYYDDELVALVAERDHSIIRKYAYRFGD